MKIGLYVHIPFCKSKCYYCDFLSFPKQSEIPDYVAVLVKELENYGKKIQGAHTIGSIFIGGGTPTVLPPFLLDQVCAAIETSFERELDCEWTIEANPGSVTDEHLDVIEKRGINRVSLGLQAVQERLLRKIGRTHTLADWQTTVNKLKQRGITNVNTDVMFGLPEQTLADWQLTLETVAKSGIPHLSAYSLIIEEDTPFYCQYEKQALALPDEDVEREMYVLAKQYLKTQGYSQYEISNWAKEGHACKHNCVYWQTTPYIGCGLGAHGYLDGIRYNNTENMADYLATQGNLSEIVVGNEVLTQKMQMEEFMFLGLRMLEGISMHTFHQKFQKDVFEIYGEVLTQWINTGLLVKTEDRLFLTDRGIEVSNQVFASFL